MSTLEGKWDCAQCLTRGISGLKTSCPNCNDPHNEHLDPSEEWYLPDDAQELTSPDELEYANSGPLWNCGYCGQPNRGDEAHCGECKKPRDADDFVSAIRTYVAGVDAEGVTLSNTAELKQDWVDATLQRADVLQVLEQEPVTMPPRTLPDSELPTHGSPWPQYSQKGNSGKDDNLSGSADPLKWNLATLRDRFNANRRPALIVAALIIVLGLFGTGGAALYDNYIATHTVDVTVRSLSWERQVEVEELRTLTQEDWTYPGDARVLSSRREIRSYRQVLDHYETRTRQVSEQKQTGTRTERYACGSTRVSNGNGTFTERTTYCNRSVPVYTTVYRTETYQVPIYRNEPVYDTKYRYQIDRWVTDHWDTANSSTHGQAPIWPGATIRGPKQRVGNERHETYGAVLADAQERTFAKSFSDMSIWSKLTPGMVLKGEQTRTGDLREVHWP